MYEIYSNDAKINEQCNNMINKCYEDSRGLYKSMVSPIIVDINGLLELQGKINDDFFIRVGDISIYEKNIINSKIFSVFNNQFQKLWKVIFDDNILKDAIIVLLKKEEEEHELIIYRGNDKIFHQERVGYEYILSYPYQKLMYCVKNKDKYDYYELDFCSFEKEYLASRETFNFRELRLNYSNENEKLKYDDSGVSEKDFIDEESITFYIHKDNSKWYKIFMGYCQEKNIFIEKIKNQFTDDMSENYKIEVNNDNIFDIIFLDYCCCSGGLYGCYIYSARSDYIIELLNIKNETSNKLESLEKKVYYYHRKDIYRNLSNEDREYMQNIQKHFKENLTVEYVKNNVDYIFYNYVNSSKYIMLYLNKQGIDNLNEVNILNKTVDINLYNKCLAKSKEIYDRLVKENKIHVKWKREYELYMLVKEYFDSAVFQYYPDWLHGQSIDIYIPEINVGIEYQGQQHYHSVDFFGGKDNFDNNINRDKRKKYICDKNNVKLIQWKYDEKIYAVNLKSKLKSVGIEVKKIADNEQISFL